MSDDALAFEVALAVLRELSPAEAEVLGVLGPEALGEGTGDGALGFGVDPDTWLSVAGFLGTSVGGFLVTLACERGSDAAKDVARRLVHRLRRGEPEPGDPAFSPEDLERIGEAARHSALAHGIDERRADLVAKAIVGAVSFTEAS